MAKPSKSKKAIIMKEGWKRFMDKSVVRHLAKSYSNLIRIRFDSEGNMIKEGKAYGYALKHFPHLLKEYEGSKK